MVDVDVVLGMLVDKMVVEMVAVGTVVEVVLMIETQRQII